MKMRVIRWMPLGLAMLLVSMIALQGGNVVGDEQGYESIVEGFFAKVQAGDLGGAVADIYATNPWMADKADEIASLQKQIANLPTVVGDYYGYEPVVLTRLGDRLIYCHYIVYFSREPIRSASSCSTPHSRSTSCTRRSSRGSRRCCRADRGVPRPGPPPGPRPASGVSSAHCEAE